jgi:hypothetical protein
VFDAKLFRIKLNLHNLLQKRIEEGLDAFVIKRL